MKKLLIAGIAAVVLIAALAFLLLSNLDAIVARAIEKHGSETTGTAVAVSGVKISLREGRGSIRGLEVASPEGFGAPKAFALADITIAIDIGSVRQDPVVITELRIEEPVVNAEISRTGATNIGELRQRIQASASGSATAADRSSGKVRRLRIDRIVFERGRIEVDASALDAGRRTLELPGFRLDDVGGREGAPPEEISRAILTAVAQRAIAEIGSAGLDRLLREKVEGAVGEEAQKLLEGLGK
jgi:hypothetical protein